MRRSPTVCRRARRCVRWAGTRSPLDCRLVKGLERKRVVVTGGTSGIGEATSRRFLDEGAHVVALAFGEEEVATAAERIPGLTAALRCDVANPAEVTDAFARVDQLLGGVDVLI